MVSDKNSDAAYQTYVYKGEGFGGDFTISIGDDGTFSYYEGMLSSYIGFGTWKLEGDLLILSEDEKVGYDFVHYFEVDENKLIFKEDVSDNFLYVKLKDGEEFIAID